MIKTRLVTISLFIPLTVILILNTNDVLAIGNATSSAVVSATPSSSVIDNLKKIQNLKEKIATKVAEIRQNEKAGLFGTIKKIDKTTFTITNKNIDRSFTSTEDTIYYSLSDGTKKESSFQNLKAGTAITILGYYDESKTTLSAKYVYIEKPNIHLTGKIADIDKTNFTITIKEPQGSTIVDIENFTKITTFSKEKGTIKIGFSKLNIGDSIHVIGSQNTKEANRATASRIVTLSFNPPQVVTPTLSKETATPSATPKVKPTT